MEILRRTPWSRIREQNSAYEEFLEIVGNGKPTGSVWMETIAVSATIRISVEKLHHQIRLRIISCNRMSENHREPEVPEARVPVLERLDGLARITLEELAITHVAKNVTLENACSTRPRVFVGLVKSALLHIVRLTHSRRNGPNRIMTKAPWLYWKRVIGKKENLSPMDVTIDRGNLGRGVIRNWDKIHLNSIFWCTAIGLCISGHDAAEVNSPEVHRRAEANPTCEIHKGYCTSHQNSRPTSFARKYLPKWTSST